MSDLNQVLQRFREQFVHENVVQLLVINIMNGNIEQVNELIRHVNLDVPITCQAYPKEITFLQIALEYEQHEIAAIISENMNASENETVKASDDYVFKMSVLFFIAAVTFLVMDGFLYDRPYLNPDVIHSVWENKQQNFEEVRGYVVSFTLHIYEFLLILWNSIVFNFRTMSPV